MASKAAQGAPYPLRPYYQPPDDTNIFVASAQQPSTSAVASSRRNNETPLNRMPSQNNRYARLDDDDLAAAAQLGSLAELAKAGVFSLALQYSSTCIAMPFEVGKLLLQVQWVPKDDVWRVFVAKMAGESPTSVIHPRRVLPLNAATNTPGQRPKRLHNTDQDDGDEEDMAPEAQEWRRAARYDPEASEDEDENDLAREADEVLSSPSDVDAYFRDATEASFRPRRPPLKLRCDPATDSAGYLVRHSVAEGHDSGSRPEFVMPVVVRGGVWEMMKAVARGKEGWPGLWKGTFTSFVYDILASGIQPIVSAIVSPLIPGSFSILPLPYAPSPRRTLALLVLSHIITHLLLGPLDLIRTRLIVQSTLPRHRKYTGPWDALKKILSEEGGWRTMYGHPHLVLPALLDVMVRPLLSLSAPLILERCLHVEPMTSPVSYAFAELVLNTSSLLFSIPIETVRRRLQVQDRSGWSKHVLIEHGNHANLLTMPVKKRNGPRSALPGRRAGSIFNTGTVRGLRTCVETRPKPYTGVIEAIYRILTEETAYISSYHQHHHHHLHRRSHYGAAPSRAGSSESDYTRSKESNRRHPSGFDSAHQQTETHDFSADGMARSEIIAPQQSTHAFFGGLRSLYRGFTMAAGANLLVFLLTVVTGERVSANAAAGRAGGSIGGVGGWAEI